MNSGFISSVKYAEGLPRPSLLKLSFIFMNLWHNFHFISIMLTNLVSYTVFVGVLCTQLEHEPLQVGSVFEDLILMVWNGASHRVDV